MSITKFDSKTKDFTEIYSDLYPLVYSTVYSKMGNIDETKDVCQEVFFRFFNKFEEVENPRKWLLGTMRYVILEHYNKKENKNLDIDDIFDDINLTFVNGFKDTRIIIEEALNNMDNFEDEQGKTLFELIAVNNLTYKKAGQHLGLSEWKVRYKYGIIVKKLTEYFKNRGINSLEDLL